MTTASPPAPTAQVLFFSRLQRLQPSLTRTGRVSTCPFKVARDRGHDDGRNGTDDIRAQAARVIQTTAESWWPPEP